MAGQQECWRVWVCGVLVAVEGLFLLGSCRLPRHCFIWWPLGSCQTAACHGQVDTSAPQPSGSTGRGHCPALTNKDGCILVGQCQGAAWGQRGSVAARFHTAVFCAGSSGPWSHMRADLAGITSIEAEQGHADLATIASLHHFISVQLVLAPLAGCCFRTALYVLSITYNVVA